MVKEMNVSINLSKEYNCLTVYHSASEYNPHVEKAELYRLRIKEQPHEKGVEKTWHVAETGRTQPETLPEIPGSEDHGGYMEDRHARAIHEDIHHNEVDNDRPNSPPLPPLPLEATSNALRSYPQGVQWASAEWQNQQFQQFPSWQRVYQRLLNWALVWPEAELQRALASTLPGVHVDEVALTIWLTQTYKRYVRAKHVEHPPGRVDRLYIPPNIADAINVAVFNGRHGDAKVMLRDLWAPFGFDGMPRLLIVLARHRRDANHYVVHRYAICFHSLSDVLLIRFYFLASLCLRDRSQRMTRIQRRRLLMAGYESIFTCRVCVVADSIILISLASWMVVCNPSGMAKCHVSPTRQFGSKNHPH